MYEKLEEIKGKYNELTRLLSDPEIIADQTRFQKYAKRYSELSQIVDKYTGYKKVLKEIDELEEIIKEDDDPEFVDMAKDELSDLKDKKGNLEDQLRIMLLPKDPDDERNIILEIRAGTGGNEAGLFAGDLFRMYAKYAERNWEKGMPFSRCVASLKRHLMKFLQGKRDEDHLAAIMFNTMALIHYEEMIERGVLPRNLNDLPNYQPRKRRG